MSAPSVLTRLRHLTSRSLSLLIVLLLACGGGSDNPADPDNGDGDGGSTLSNASLRGYVYQTNPVHVVDDPVRAPEGSSPVSGADVSAYDIDGFRIGQETTSTDGEFWFEDLPPGYARVEVTISGSAVADTTFAITGVAGVEILAGRKHVIDRAAAIVAATAGTSEDALILGTLQPLPAGTVVEALRDSEVVETLRTLTADEWFFLIDLSPSAGFDHRADFVYVDAVTGAVVTQAANTRPHVNGRLQWGSDRDYIAYRNVDWDAVGVAEQPLASASVGAEVVQLPPEPQENAASFTRAARTKGAGDPEDVFTFNLTLSSETSTVIDGNRMENAFEAQGIPSLNRFDLYTPDLMPSELGPAVTGVINGLNEAMQERIDEGGDPTLVFYVSGHSGFVDGAPTGNLLIDLADDRDAARSMWFFSLHNTVATRVRVILETCYAELHAQDLKEHFGNIPFENRPDLKVYAASEEDETANARPYWQRFVYLGAITPGGTYTTTLLPHFRIEDGDVAGLKDEEGELIPELRELTTAVFNTQHPLLCCLEGGRTTVPTSLIDVDIQSLAFQHVVGGEDCPVSTGVITLTNTSNRTVEWTAEDTGDDERIAPEPSAGTLAPGASVGIDMKFLCNTEESFDTSVRIGATTLDGSVQDEIMIGVGGAITPDIDPGDVDGIRMTVSGDGADKIVEFKASEDDANVLELIGTWFATAGVTLDDKDYNLSFQTPSGGVIPGSFGIVFGEFSDIAVNLTYRETVGGDMGRASKGEGTVTVDVADGSRFAGSFTFTAALSGQITGTRVITGDFDIPIGF